MHGQCPRETWFLEQQRKKSSLDNECRTHKDVLLLHKGGIKDFFFVRKSCSTSETTFDQWSTTWFLLWFSFAPRFSPVQCRSLTVGWDVKSTEFRRHLSINWSASALETKREHTGTMRSHTSDKLTRRNVISRSQRFEAFHHRFDKVIECSGPWTRWIIKRQQSALFPFNELTRKPKCSTWSLQMSNIYHSISLRFFVSAKRSLLFDETGCALHKTSRQEMRDDSVSYSLVDAFYLSIISFMIHKLSSRDFIASVRVITKVFYFHFPNWNRQRAICFCCLPPSLIFLFSCRGWSWLRKVLPPSVLGLTHETISAEFISLLRESLTSVGVLACSFHHLLWLLAKLIA